MGQGLKQRHAYSLLGLTKVTGLNHMHLISNSQLELVIDRILRTGVASGLRRDEAAGTHVLARGHVTDSMNEEQFVLSVLMQEGLVEQRAESSRRRAESAAANGETEAARRDQEKEMSAKKKKKYTQKVALT